MTNAPLTPRAFGERDGDLRHLAERAIGFIGYGNQGRAQALNLRDSGIGSITIGTLRDESWTQAEADGFAVQTIAEAAQHADVLFLLIPDEELPGVYAEQVAPHLQPNDALVFASGYNLTFKGIAPPENVDVLLLAPRMIGRQLRELYERGEGFYSYVSVEQDASGKAWPLLLALAKGIGTLRLGALELSAKDETLLDLFHEQGFGSLIGATFMLMMEIGMEAGLPAEAIALDLYLSGEATQTFQAMADLGFYEQSKLHSITSQYGGMMRTIGMDREPLRQHLQRIMDDIRDGSFAKQLASERDAGYENFNRLHDAARVANPFSPIEQRLREAFKEAQDRDETGA